MCTYGICNQSTPRTSDDFRYCRLDQILAVISPNSQSHLLSYSMIIICRTIHTAPNEACAHAKRINYLFSDHRHLSIVANELEFANGREHCLMWTISTRSKVDSYHGAIRHFRLLLVEEGTTLVEPSNSLWAVSVAGKMFSQWANKFPQRLLYGDRSLALSWHSEVRTDWRTLSFKQWGRSWCGGNAVRPKSPMFVHCALRIAVRLFIHSTRIQRSSLSPSYFQSEYENPIMKTRKLSCLN